MTDDCQILVVDAVQNHGIAFDAKEKVLLGVVVPGEVERFDVFRSLYGNSRCNVAEDTKGAGLMAGFAEEQIGVKLQQFSEAQEGITANLVLAVFDFGKVAEVNADLSCQAAEGNSASLTGLANELSDVLRHQCTCSSAAAE